MNHGLTVGIPSTGNIQGLLCCLTGILSSSIIPQEIIIRLEGEFPSFANFYLEQLSELARTLGTKTHLVVCRSEGIRASRDYLVSSCSTRHLLMLDDDVLLDSLAIEQFEDFFPLVGEDFSFICGSKVDVNNRRGYGDYEPATEPREFSGEDDCPTNYRYKVPLDGRIYCRIIAADTGCILLNVPVLRQLDLRFCTHSSHFNSGGEDSVFGALCAAKSRKGFFLPSALAWHLEKPVPSFSQFAARSEAVLRTVESLGLDPATLKSVMSWMKPFVRTEEHDHDKKTEVGIRTAVQKAKRKARSKRSK